MDVQVRAAGGVVVRDGKVLVVHRPRYDDWSLPKGKLTDGESWEAAALREVEEETGFRPQLGRWLGETRYLSAGGPKSVQYWTMTPRDGEFTADDEVDELRWLEPSKALALLSYDHDRGLLERFCAAGSAHWEAAGR